MPPPPHRALWIVVLIVCALWIGLIAGAYVGARFFVPPGSGLAAGASVLGYGVIGAVAGLVLAAVLAAKLPASALRTVALVMLVASIAVLAWIGYRARQQQTERREAAGLDVPLPTSSELRVEALIDDSYDTRSYRRLDISGAGWRASWVAVGPTSPTCTTTLTAAEASAVDSHLQALEARLAQPPAPCAGETSSSTHRLSWRRGTDAARSWAAQGGADCLQTRSEWSTLVFALQRIPIDAVSGGRATCEAPGGHE